MYFNAYRNKKQSEIIKTLYRLFFFKAIMFLGLALLSFAQFAGNPQLGIILRVITLPVFVAIIWELFQFAKWSTEPDGIDEEKLMETKLEKQHKNHKVSFGGYEV
ncbi:MAG: hypothetical protein M1445_08475 [Bacteroidetes bacterium]|nr:hypothetical protein [Bacteroidota bacterium]